MDFSAVLNDKSIKPKEKTDFLSNWLLQNPDEINTLIDFAKGAKDPVKASLIEVMEYATRSTPAIATPECLYFVSQSLAEKAPRVKMESGRVVGNIARCFPDQLEETVNLLLANTTHEGTVVRWSAAFALGEIIKLKTALNTELIPAAESICEKEEKNSIRNIYLAALKKAKATPKKH